MGVVYKDQGTRREWSYGRLSIFIEAGTLPSPLPKIWDKKDHDAIVSVGPNWERNKSRWYVAGMCLNPPLEWRVIDNPNITTYLYVVGLCNEPARRQIEDIKKRIRLEPSPWSPDFLKSIDRFLQEEKAKYDTIKALASFTGNSLDSLFKVSRLSEFYERYGLLGEDESFQKAASGCGVKIYQ